MKGGNGWLSWGPEPASVGTHRLPRLFTAYARSSQGPGSVPVAYVDEFDVRYWGDYFGTYFAAGALFATIGVGGTDWIVVDDGTKMINYTGRYCVGSEFSPTVTSSNGPPTHVEPVSSICLRADGAPGSFVYVSHGGGVWSAIA